MRMPFLNYCSFACFLDIIVYLLLLKLQYVGTCEYYYTTLLAFLDLTSSIFVAFDAGSIAFAIVYCYLKTCCCGSCIQGIETGKE